MRAGDGKRLIDFLRPARRLLVFTGAGVSTGSGIPDFRGPGGVWTRRQPVYYAEFLASEAKRIEHWEYKAEAWAGFRDARPNATHFAVAELERLGRVAAVVTQNIDGLHRAACTSEALLVELHGTNREVACVACGERGNPEPALARFAQERRCPRCECGGFLKFATVSFGQALDEAVLGEAFAAAATADRVLALGSTLSVQPAASVPLAAARAGAPYAIVNRGPTDHDGIATLRIEGDVADVVPAAVAALAAET